MIRSSVHALPQAAGALLLAAAALTASAQGAEAGKAVVVEPAPAFSRWVETVVLPTMPAVPATGITTVVPAPAIAGAAPMAYQPWPVILGTPEVPLVGAAADGRWSAGYNYQGMHVRLLVLDRDGRTLRPRSLSTPPVPGERFRIRVTPSFDAVAEVGLVTGEPWSAFRAGQLYPQPGMSVAIDAGQTADLPLEVDRFFVMGEDATRLLLAVRHPQATEAVRSQQPAYRQDATLGSSFLQLVPQGRQPAFEQLVAAAPR